VRNPDFLQGLSIGRVRVGDVILPSLLELLPGWVLGMILQVKQHESHDVLGSFRLRSGIGLCSLDSSKTGIFSKVPSTKTVESIAKVVDKDRAPKGVNAKDKEQTGDRNLPPI